MNRIPACWHLSANFGDCITQTTASLLGYEACLVPWDDTRVRAVIGGSILNHARFGCIAGGVGIANRSDSIAPNVDIRWARGPITEERAIECGCKIGTPGLYGDTALCLPLILVPRPSPSSVEVFVVPHYADMLDFPEQFSREDDIREAAGGDYAIHFPVRYGSPFTQIERIAYMVNASNVVVTSSLHAMILAHAWGKPVVWIRSERVLGDGTKFADHLSSVHLEHEHLSSTWEEAADPGRLAELVAGAKENPPLVTREHQMAILQQLQSLLEDVHAQKQDPQFIPAPSIEPKVPPMKILMKMPTRRPEKALEIIKGYREKASGMNEILWVISLDSNDDRSMGFQQEFRDLGCFVHTGRSISKVHAGNRDLQGYPGCDIYVLTADDMVCKEFGWDQIIAEDMRKHFPNLDGVLHYNDGHRGQGLNTLPIMGRVCFENAGRKFYNEEYVSLFADDEFTRDHKSVYIDRVIIDHQHPVWTGAPRDDLLKFTESLAGIDKRTFERRKARGFPKYRPLLTIGICTVPGREVMLRSLMYILEGQRADLPEPEAVEIVTNLDDGSKHTGTKRNEILDAANGRFVCFVDDDDMVSVHYLKRLVEAIMSDPYQDAIGFPLEMTTNGMNPKKAIHKFGQQDGKWYEDGLAYYRGPGHLQPVRVDLARRTRFPEVTHAEDLAYAQKLYPLLELCGYIDEILYFYLYRNVKGEPALKVNKPASDQGVRVVEGNGLPLRHQLAPRPPKRGMTI